MPDGRETEPQGGGAKRLLADLGRDEALAFHDKALGADPGDPAANLGRGISFAGLGKYREALECFETVLEADPANVIANIDKGYVLAGLDRFEEAISCYGRALKKDRSNVIANVNKGHALAGLGRFREALACYDAALEKDPKNVTARDNRDDALARIAGGREARGNPDYVILPDDGVFAGRNQKRGSFVRDFFENDTRFYVVPEVAGDGMPDGQAVHRRRTIGARDVQSLRDKYDGTKWANHLKRTFAEIARDGGEDTKKQLAKWYRLQRIKRLPWPEGKRYLPKDSARKKGLELRSELDPAGGSLRMLARAAYLAKVMNVRNVKIMVLTSNMDYVMWMPQIRKRLDVHVIPVSWYSKRWNKYSPQADDALDTLLGMGDAELLSEFAGIRVSLPGAGD